MANQNEQKNMVIELLKEGYAPDLISTIGIPIEIINECQVELEEENRKRNIEREEEKPKDRENLNKEKFEDESKKTKMNEGYRQSEGYRSFERDSSFKAHKKMQRMREKLNYMLEIDSVKKKTPRKIQTEEEKEKIDKNIEKVQEKIGLMNDKSLVSFEVSKSVLHYLKQLESLDLEIDQLETILGLISQKIKKQSLGNDIKKAIDKYEGKFVRALAKRIREKSEEVDSIEELESLSRKLSSYSANLSSNMKILLTIDIESVISEIHRKVLKIKARDIEIQNKNSMSNSIKNIINSIAIGEFDYDKAVEIINEEASKRLEQAPKTKFSLSKEQHVKQIKHIIGETLVKEADRYELINPRKAINDLINLNDGNQSRSLYIVVKNLITRKDFETAKEICEQHNVPINFEQASFVSKGNNLNNMGVYARDFKKEVLRAEVADMVMEYLNKDTYPAEERAFLENLEKRLKRENISMSSIILGKTKDGLRTITLEDIYKEDKQVVHGQ